MALSKSDVSALYVAIFNRASEGEGNTYWQTVGTAAEVADAMLETAPAKAYFGAALDNDEDFIAHIYLNTLGKTAEQDPEGIAYWVGELATQSRGEVIARLIESALDPVHEGTDAQNLFKNMVAVSDYAADTIEEAPEDLAVLRFDAGLKGVTADEASVETAKEAIDEVVNPPHPVVKALNNLEEAKADVEAFRKEAAKLDFVDAAGEKATDDDIAEAVSSADAAVAARVTGYAVSDSAAKKAATIKYQEELNQIALTEANAKLKTANDNILKVDGAAAALARAAATDKDAKAKADAAAASATAANAELAKFNTLNKTELDFEALFEKGDNGRQKLKEGVTEAKYPGVTVVLNAYQAQLDAFTLAATAETAAKAAFVAALYFDSVASKEAINDAFSKPVEDASKLTQAQVQAELNKLFAEAQSEAEQALERNDEGLIVGASGDAVGAYNALREAVNDFEGQKVPGPLAQAQIAATQDVEEAQEAISDLAEAVEALQTAQELAAELKVLKDAVDTAEKALEDMGVKVQEVDNNTVVGTAEDDIFVVGEGGTIVSFGLQGDDSIYVGADFSLVALTATQDINASVGNAAALEVFAKQVGSDVELYVEQKAFAGNATGQADLVNITLTGVSVDDLVLEDGFLSIA